MIVVWHSRQKIGLAPGAAVVTVLRRDQAVFAVVFTF